LRHFRRSYLKANKVSISKGTRKLNMHNSFEGALMPQTENFQNWSMLVEATACQSWRVF